MRVSLPAATEEESCQAKLQLLPHFSREGTEQDRIHKPLTRVTNTLEENITTRMG